jgi:hypothetical protein
MVYEQITRHGWFSRIRESIKGIVGGLVLLVLALGLQFWNEGRTLKRDQALGEGRAQVLEVAAASPQAENDGRLVHVSGVATAATALLDDTFGVEQQALALRRHVEMYQWREKKETREEKSVGGSKQEITRYTYEKRWSDELEDSTRFKEEAQHRNPGEMPYRDASWRADDIRIGGFRLGEDAASEIGGWRELAPADVALPPNLAASFRSAGEWFVSSETPAQPQIGDLRVRFEIVPEGPLTVIARQQAGVLDTWRSSRDAELLLVDRGEHTPKAMFDAAAASNSSAGWALRFAGFVLAWVGFGLLLKPFAVLADVVPVFGRFVGVGLTVLAGLCAALLSIVAIGGGWLWHRPWLLGVVVVLIAAGIVWLVKRRSRNACTMAAPGSPPPPPSLSSSPPPPPPPPPA